MLVHVTVALTGLLGMLQISLLPLSKLEILAKSLTSVLKYPRLVFGFSSVEQGLGMHMLLT